MSILNNLPHKCSIFRRKFAKGDLGGRKPSHTLVGSNVPCWEQSTGANEITEYQKDGMNVTKKVYFVTNPAVTVRHILVVTERNGVAVSAADQVELKVVGTPLPDTTVGLEIAYKVICTQVTSKE